MKIPSSFFISISILLASKLTLALPRNNIIAKEKSVGFYSSAHPLEMAQTATKGRRDGIFKKRITYTIGDHNGRPYKLIQRNGEYYLHDPKGWGKTFRYNGQTLNENGQTVHLFDKQISGFKSMKLAANKHPYLSALGVTAGVTGLALAANNDDDHNDDHE